MIKDEKDKNITYFAVMYLEFNVRKTRFLSQFILNFLLC